MRYNTLKCKFVIVLEITLKVEDCSYFRSFHLRDCAKLYPECNTTAPAVAAFYR